MSKTRITKDLCSEIAKKLTEPHRKKISEKRAEIGLIVFNYQKSKIPDIVLKCSLNYPHYFDFRSNVYISGNGKNYGNYNIPEKLPFHSENYSKKIMLDNKTDLLLERLANEESDLRIRCNSIESEIKSVLYELKSYKNIREQIPEASKYLPKDEISSKSLVNIDSLRTKINES